MNNSEFFMILPSNTKFEGNTAANFTVRLPQKISLEGQWEVALSEIMYPHSWYNVSGLALKEGPELDRTMQPNSFFVWLYDKLWVHCLVPRNHYKDIESLISAMEFGFKFALEQNKQRLQDEAETHRKAFEEEILMFRNTKKEREKDLLWDFSILDHKALEAGGKIEWTPQKEALKQQYEAEYKAIEENVELVQTQLKDWKQKEKLLADIPRGDNRPLKFGYDENRWDFFIELDGKHVTKIQLSPTLAYMLGYSDSSKPRTTFTDKRNMSTFPPDLSAGFYALYVYCTLVENQVVGNYRVPLLRTVHVAGKHGDICEKIFPSPHYVPMLSKDFDTIEIDIKNDKNHSVEFSFGKTVVKLHFRKKRNYY